MVDGFISLIGRWGLAHPPPKIIGGPGLENRDRVISADDNENVKKNAIGLN